MENSQDQCVNYINDREIIIFAHINDIYLLRTQMTTSISSQILENT